MRLHAHGHFVSRDMQKLSKSRGVGNVTAADEQLAKIMHDPLLLCQRIHSDDSDPLYAYVGADVLRWYFCRLDA